MNVTAKGRPAASGHPHLVQLYRSGDELGLAVAAFLDEGLVARERTLVIATREHAALFAAQLRHLGHDVAALEADGALTFVDGRETLEALLADGTVARAGFERTIVPLVRRAVATGVPVRVYGELVDLLWQRGQPEAAIHLEELWNELGERLPFTLLCGYAVDVFDHAPHVSFLPELCRTHSAVAPGPDGDRLEQAVDAALTETLGAAKAAEVYARVAAHARNAEIPRFQLALTWLAANMPAAADRVFAAARAHAATA